MPVEPTICMECKHKPENISLVADPICQHPEFIKQDYVKGHNESKMHCYSKNGGNCSHFEPVEQEGE